MHNLEVFVLFRYDRLEALIAESGKTKVSLCGKIKKCPTYLRDAKKQNTDIKGKTLEILAFELNTTPEYLSGETDEKKPTTQTDGELSEKDMRILKWFRSLPEEKQKAILTAQDGPVDAV